MRKNADPGGSDGSAELLVTLTDNETPPGLLGRHIQAGMSRFVTPQHTYNARGHMTTDAHTDALAATQASRSSPDAADAARNAQHRHPRRRQRHLRHLWEAMGTQRRSSRRGRRVLSCYLAHPGEEVQLVLVHLRAPPGGGEMGWQSSGIAPLLRLEVSHLASHEAQLRMQLPTREEVVKGRRRGNERSEGGLRGGTWAAMRVLLGGCIAREPNGRCTPALAHLVLSCSCQAGRDGSHTSPAIAQRVNDRVGDFRSVCRQGMRCLSQRLGEPGLRFKELLVTHLSVARASALRTMSPS